MTRFPAKPPVRQIDPVIFKNVKKASLDNGTPVYLINAGTEDILRIEFIFSAGYINESGPLIASTTNLMLAEGTLNHSSAKLAGMLDYYGSFHNLYCEKDKAGLVLLFLNRYAGKMLDLAQQMLFEPAFKEHELRTLMRKRLRWFLVNREKVQNLANDRFFEAIFGKDHPYGKIISEKDFESVTIPVIRNYHSAFYTHGSMAIIASGMISQSTFDLINKTFGGIKPDSTPTMRKEFSVSRVGEKKIHTEKKGAVQTAVRIGSATINKRHPDYIGLKVTDTILGGYFGSRLMKNIREEKGLTYGIYSSVTSLDLTGYKLISAEVSKEFTQKAIDEIFSEIKDLREKPVGKDELEIVRNFMLGEMIRMFDGPFALAESFRSAWEFGLDNSYYQRMAEKIRTITPDEIMKLAQTYYNIDDMYQVTAG